MVDVTVASFEEMEPIYDGLARRARATLGVSGWGMQVMTLPPNWDGYPNHRHDASVEDANQEEVYIPLEGSGLLYADGEAFDLISHLKSCRDEVIETPVRLGLKKGEPLKMRLIALRKSEAAAEEARRKINKEAKAKSKQVRQETLIAAGFVILVTSLAQEAFPAETVLKLYRMRWRIELAFKRLKSLIGLRAPPAKDPRIARPWILAHFLIALVTEPLSQEFGVSPP